MTDEDEVEIEVERGDPDDRLRDQTLRPTAADAPERALEDELGRIDLLTTPEGYVEGRVTALESVDERTVRLEVRLPHDERVAFTLEKPIPWSTEFLLARIVEDVGYDAASSGHLVGESVYLTRTDREARDDDPDWWTASIRSAGDALVASLLSDRYRLEENSDPGWRLVDPLERPTESEDGASGWSSETVASMLVVIGAMAAALGGAVGTADGLALSSAALAYAIPGLLLVLLGLVALFEER